MRPRPPHALLAILLLATGCTAASPAPPDAAADGSATSSPPVPSASGRPSAPDAADGPATPAPAQTDTGSAGSESPPGADDFDAMTPDAGGPAESNAPTPPPVRPGRGARMLATPPDFQLTDQHVDGWWEIARSPTCSVSFRDAVLTNTPADATFREASLRLAATAVREAEGRGASAPVDILMPIDAMSIGGQSVGWNAVAVDFSDGRARRVRLIARVSVWLTYTGKVPVEGLMVRFVCDHNRIDEAAWAQARPLLRGAVASGREQLGEWPTATIGQTVARFTIDE